MNYSSCIGLKQCFKVDQENRLIKKTKPKLKVEHSAPARVLIGDDIAFSITITNEGTGAATDVILEEDLPKGLAHSSGRALESAIGTLQPLAIMKEAFQ